MCFPFNSSKKFIHLSLKASSLQYRMKNADHEARPKPQNGCLHFRFGNRNRIFMDSLENISILNLCQATGVEDGPASTPGPVGVTSQAGVRCAWRGRKQQRIAARPKTGSQSWGGTVAVRKARQKLKVWLSPYVNVKQWATLNNNEEK